MKQEIILCAIYLVVQLLVLLVSLLTKPKVKMIDSIFEQLLVVLPVMIRQAESSMKTGEAKKESVIFYALQWLVKMTGKSLDEVSSVYKERISNAIEDILSTPQKKEVS